MFRVFVTSYLMTQIAAAAGANHNPYLLYFGIIIGYFVITRWFPPFPYPVNNKNGEE